MATRLLQVVQFVGVAAGDTDALPHAINVNGIQKTPDLCMTDQPGVTAAATSTTVSVTNTTESPVTVNVWLEYKHSMVRVLGQTINNLTPQPFVASSGGAPSSLPAAAHGAFVWEVGVTWAAIYAQMQAVQGPKICLVEAAVGGRNMTAGLTPTNINDIYFWGMEGTQDGTGEANTSAVTRINVEDGFTLAPSVDPVSGFNNYYVRSKDIAWYVDATTTPLYVITGFNQAMFYIDSGTVRSDHRIGSGRTVLVLRNGASIEQTGASRLFLVTTSGETVTMTGLSSLDGDIFEDDTNAWDVTINMDPSCYFDPTVVGAPGTRDVTVTNRAAKADGTLYDIAISGGGALVVTPT